MAPPVDERRGVASATPTRCTPAIKRSVVDTVFTDTPGHRCVRSLLKDDAAVPVPHQGVLPATTGVPNGVVHTTFFPALSGTGVRACSFPVSPGTATRIVPVFPGWTIARPLRHRGIDWVHQSPRTGDLGSYRAPFGIYQSKKVPNYQWVTKTSNRFSCLSDAPQDCTVSNTSIKGGKSRMNIREFSHAIETSRHGGSIIEPLTLLEQPVHDEHINSAADLALTECDIAEFHDENAYQNDVEESTDNSNKNKHVPLSIGLWNINSIDQLKFDYCVNFLNKQKNSILCLTELSSENRGTIHLLAKHKDFPIMTHPDSKRVGIMIPQFLKDSIEVVDTWSWCQVRNRNSDKAVQLTIFKVNLSSITITIIVVYAAPDTNIEGKRALCRKLCELGKTLPNSITVGDFNIDVKDRDKKRFLKTELGAMYTQIVKDFTRVKARNFDGSLRISKTCIDLVFLSNDIKQKLLDTPMIIKDAPSDHFLVNFSLDIKVASKYVVKEYFLDPTRRRPIPKSKLQEANNALSDIIVAHSAEFEKANRVESMRLISDLLIQVLNIYSPLNEPGMLTKRIYRFTMSPELRKLKKLLVCAKNKWRMAVRQKKKSRIVTVCRDKHRVLRNRYNRAVKSCKHKQKASKLYDGIMSHNNIWSIIKKFLPDPDYRPPSVTMEIKGKSGKELADHMAKFFYDRAHLVSDEEALACEAFIPTPSEFPSIEIDIDDSMKYTVAELFQGKKKPSLAAGPDTISHRHIVDLMPSLADSLQASLNKPLMEFTDIRKSYTRLLDKEVVTSKTVLTEKSQRPISELNALPKYGSIKIFIDQLRCQLLKVLKDNQYAFPGKGGPMAIVKTLDDASELSAKGLKTLILLWDFSNAFCTTIHNIIVDIARKFNLSDKMIALLKQFLEQSFSAIKFSDSKGYYISDDIDTGRGTPQGQIGSDLIFALVNDSIDPIRVLDEIIIRTKYVDDFTDVLAASGLQTLFKSYKCNEAHLKNSATSVGLKLNEGKTKIIPLNIHPDDLLNEYQNRYVYREQLLGFKFSVIGAPPAREKEIPSSRSEFHMSLRNTRSEGHYTIISGDPAASELISRLASAARTMYTLRKFEKNILTNLKAATALVWSSCYDLGCVRAYCSDSIWNDVCKSIRKVIKAAGLDHMTNSEIVYRVSTGYSPDIMALKQIVQLGIKFLDEDSFSESYKVLLPDSETTRPFWHRFVTEFNALPYTLREYIADSLDPGNKSAMDKIKRRLKSHYTVLYNPNGKLTKDKISKLIDENSYSKAKIEKRKRDYEVIRQSRITASLVRAKKEKDKLLATPCKRRKKFSTSFVTPKVLRQIAHCYGPKRDAVKDDLHTDYIIEGSTPLKRPRDQVALDHSGSVSKRLRSSDNAANASNHVENVRRAIPDLIHVDFLDIPSGKPRPTGIFEDVISFEHCEDIQMYQSTSYSEIDSELACSPTSFRISDPGHDIVVSGTEDIITPTLKGDTTSVQQLYSMDFIASFSPWQYKTGPRKEKREKLKQLYRLNRLRPPEKSNT